MIIKKDPKTFSQLNEIMINVGDSLNPNIENSIYYPKIKHLLFGEINNFCKERIELRQDLHILRQMIGDVMTEQEIRSYLDNLMDKYNGIEDNIGILYHIEVTRLDYGVPVVIIIKRDEIYAKKFVFRFRKDLKAGIGSLSSSGMFKEKITKELVGDNDEV